MKKIIWSFVKVKDVCFFCKVSKGMVNDKLEMWFRGGMNPNSKRPWVSKSSRNFIHPWWWLRGGRVCTSSGIKIFGPFLEERHIRLAYHGQNPQLAGNCGASPPLQFRLAYDCRDNHIQCFDVLLKNNSNPTNTRFLTKNVPSWGFS